MDIRMQVPELHEAATAYYINSDRGLQVKAWNFFCSMDTDGNQRVSFHELVEFFRQCGHNWADYNLFNIVDRNHDGHLDFWEFLTLYYIMNTRGVWCQSCRLYQIGLYFTCVACFDSASNTYDLCTDCYSKRRHGHHHISFLDNYVLLRSKRGLPPGQPNLNQALVHQGYIAPNAPRESHWWRAVEAFGMALNVGAMVTQLGCSIM